jgi:hypothetical protein
MPRKNLIKLADDASFEQNFFQLAFAYIRDKIPNLLDYMLGFEVVNKNDEGTQAIGLFKFDVAGRQLFVPVFYKNGELKGAELLYNQNQDKFVPNKENWVDTLLNSRPEELGEPSGMSRGDVMVGMQSGLDLSKIYNPTINTKLSMDKMQSLAVNFDWTFPSFLKQADCRLADIYTRTLMQNPRLHKLASEAYGEELYEALSSCKQAKVEQLDNEKVPEVEVIDANSPQPVFESMTDSEKQELLEEGIVLRDNRGEGKIPYKIQRPMKLNAVDGACVYDLLMKGGAFARGVMMPELGVDNFNKHVFIPTDNDKVTPCCVESVKTFVSSFDGGTEAFKKFLDGLSSAESAKATADTVGVSDKQVSYNIFVEADGSQASAPFCLTDKVEFDGATTYKIHYGGYPMEKVVVSPAYRRMRLIDNTLYVPKAAKVHSFKAKMYSCPKIDLGDARDIDAKIKGLFDEIKVAKDRSGFTATCNGKLLFKQATRRDAYVTLVAGVGFGIDTAKDALKKAAALEEASYTFQKKAQGPFFDPGMVFNPNTPPVPMGMNPTLGVPEQYPQADTMSAMSGAPGNVLNQRVLDGISGMNQTQPALNQQAVDNIMQAAQSGERNVFDVANISELINRADIDTPLDQYMVDLNQALDRLGRIYFLMLFHGDKFSERFSQEDIPSMEESVRNTFNHLGELILKLKERKIQSDSGSAVETDLNQLV